MRVILALALFPICSGLLCSPNKYWHGELEACLSCSKCRSNQITVSPCQAHKNTECRSLTELHNLDSLLLFNDKKSSKSLVEDDLIVNNHKVHLKTSNGDDDDDNIYKDIFRRNPKNFPKHHKMQKGEKHHKNKKHFSFKKRVNDKFLDWEDYKPKKHKKDFEHEFKKGLHYHKSQGYHPLKFRDEPQQSKLWDEDLLSILDSRKHKITDHKKSEYLSKIDDEKELEKWLIESRNQLKHRKDDLLKTLKNEKKSHNIDKKIKLNYPLHKSKSHISESLALSAIKEEPGTLEEINEELIKDISSSRKDEEADLMNLLSNNREPLKYRPVIPKQRLFLGEPSTIAEMSDQIKDPQEVIKEEMGKNIIYEKSKFGVVPIIKKGTDDSVVSVPFTAAETFVWDWQAVALCSAVISCLIFFMVVAVFSLINVRQWKTIKRNYNTEVEEMSRVSLMQPLEMISTNGHQDSFSGRNNKH